MAYFDPARLLGLSVMFNRFNYAFDTTLLRFPILDKHVVERDLVRMTTRDYRTAVYLDYVDLKKTFHHAVAGQPAYRPVDSIVFGVLALGSINMQESGVYARLAAAVDDYFRKVGGVDSVVMPMFNILHALYLAFQQGKIVDAQPFIKMARSESERYFCRGTSFVKRAQDVIKDVHTYGVPLEDGEPRKKRIYEFDCARDVLKRNQSFADIFKTCYVLELYLLGSGILPSLPSCACEKSIFLKDQDNTDATDGPFVRRAKCLWYLHQCLRVNKEKRECRDILQEGLDYVNRQVMPWDYALDTRDFSSFPYDVDTAIDKATVYGCRFIIESMVVADYCWNCGCRKLDTANVTCAPCEQAGINAPSWETFTRLQRMYFAAEYAVMAFINVHHLVPSATLKFYGFIARCALTFISHFKPVHHHPVVLESLYCCWDTQYQFHRFDICNAQKNSGVPMYGAQYY